jgi:acyl-CoA hydrolase
VAIDENGQPAPVPPLVPENEEDERRMEAARQRQAYRLSQRKRT